MSATFDYSIIVNLLAAAAAATRRGFGTLLLATEDTTFSGGDIWRQYNNNSEAQADDELGDDVKAACATLFSQPVNPGVIRIGKVTMASLGTDLDAILADSDAFYAVALDSRVKADILALGTWVLANDRLGIAQSSDADFLAGTPGNVAQTLQAASNGRMVVLYHADDTEFADVAWAWKLAADPDQQSTFWRYANLAGITVDAITSTEAQNVRDNGGNCYLPFAGVPATGEGVLTDGSPIDTLITKDWYKARVFEDTAQVLLDFSARNEKPPYTDQGIAIFESVVRKRNQLGAQIGHFVDEGSVSTPKRADVPPADVTARMVRVNSTVILAGAIEEVTFNLGVLLA